MSSVPGDTLLAETTEAISMKDAISAFYDEKNPSDVQAKNNFVTNKTLDKLNTVGRTHGL